MKLIQTTNENFATTVTSFDYLLLTALKPKKHLRPNLCPMPSSLFLESKINLANKSLEGF